MTKRIIITGASGNIGYWFCHYLTKNTKFSLITKRFDITNRHETEDIINFHRPSYFINLAGKSFPSSSWENPNEYYQSNTLAVQYQLESIRLFSPKTTYINAGSSSEFSSIRNPYTQSKQFARELINLYKEKYDLTCYMPYIYNAESENRKDIRFFTKKVVSQAVDISQSIHNNKLFEPIQVGNIEAKRRFLHSLDVVDRIWHSIQSDEIIASSEEYSIKQFIEEVFNQLNIRGFWVNIAGQQQYQLDSKRVLVQTCLSLYRNEDKTAENYYQLNKSNQKWKPQIDFKQLISRLIKAEKLDKSIN